MKLKKVNCTNYKSCANYHRETFNIVCKEKKCSMYQAKTAETKQVK